MDWDAPVGPRVAFWVDVGIVLSGVAAMVFRVYVAARVTGLYGGVEQSIAFLTVVMAVVMVMLMLGATLGRAAANVVLAVRASARGRALVRALASRRVLGACGLVVVALVLVVLLAVGASQERGPAPYGDRAQACSAVMIGENGCALARAVSEDPWKGAVLLGVPVVVFGGWFIVDVVRQQMGGA